MAKRRLGARRGGGAFRATPALLTALVLAVVAVVFVVRAADNASRARAAADDALAAGADVALVPAREAGGFFAFVTNAVNADRRIDQLERENAELKQWRTLALALAERNERYEALLKMPPGSLGAFLNPDAGVSARLVLDSAGPFTRTLLANAGADHGVTPGAVVVNENGLVGRVVSVGRRSSRVLMLDDYESRIPVMGQTSRVRAVMVGSARDKLRLEGAIAAQPPNLEFAVGGQGLRVGEPVVTSGDGGLFPAGLFVGDAVQDGAEKWRVRVATSAAPIDFVRIIRYDPISAPEAGVGAPQTGVPMPEIRPGVISQGPSQGPSQGSVQAGAAPPPLPAAVGAPVAASPPRPAAAPRPRVAPVPEDEATPAPDDLPALPTP